MVEIGLANGKRAVLTALERDLVTLRSEVAAAPGSRLHGQVTDCPSLRVKVYRCVRDGEEGGTPRWCIKGRLIDATRGLLQQLEQRLHRS